MAKPQSMAQNAVTPLSPECALSSPGNDEVVNCGSVIQEGTEMSIKAQKNLGAVMPLLVHQLDLI